MQRQLILIRHTKSSWDDFSLSDFERPLKESRIDDAKNMALKLKELNLHPDLIICSPALRTKQTAAYFCEKLKYDYNKIQFEQRLYESSAQDYKEVISEADKKISTLVIIGHNPSITNYVNLFIKNRIIEIPTTGVVWLQFESEDWNVSPSAYYGLQCFLTPKTI